MIMVVVISHGGLDTGWDIKVFDTDEQVVDHVQKYRDSNCKFDWEMHVTTLNADDVACLAGESMEAFIKQGGTKKEFCQEYKCKPLASKSDHSF